MDETGVTVTADAPKETTPQTAVASEPVHKTAAPRNTDKRAERRHASVMKARAGHRRNIRRSNTNG